MVASLDGFIAKPDNSVGWFETNDTYEKGVSLSDEERAAFVRDIDCYVMGSKTYELALELAKSYGWVYGDTPTIVMTSRDLPVERPNVKLFKGDPQTLIDQELKGKFHNIWIVGGAMLAADFVSRGLADEIRYSILPVALGQGKPFFDGLDDDVPLHLLNVTPYKNGIVELHYEVGKSTQG